MALKLKKKKKYILDNKMSLLQPNCHTYILWINIADIFTLCESLTESDLKQVKG